jgi:hypothetical protein
MEVSVSIANTMAKLERFGSSGYSAGDVREQLETLAGLTERITDTPAQANAACGSALTAGDIISLARRMLLTMPLNRVPTSTS